MWDCLSVNNPTISSISILCQHSKSYININPYAAITLFKEMSIIASNDIYYSINDNFILSLIPQHYYKLNFLST